MRRRCLWLGWSLVLGVLLVLTLVLMPARAGSWAASQLAGPEAVTEDAKLMAPDAADSLAFGYSVAVSGDRIVVGALGTTGVYVYRRDSGTWTFETKLYPSDPMIKFAGLTVDIDGDTLVTSAHDQDNYASAYVFTRDAGGWQEEARLDPSDPPLLNYDWKLAISGETVVITAEYAGAAWVFRRDGSAWIQQAVLTPSDGDTYSFGEAAAISGDTIAIGTRSLKVYLYRYDGSVWTEEAILDPPINRFGGHVALSGDTLAVGARSGNPESAYVYRRSEAGWIQEGELLPPSVPCSLEGSAPVGLSGDLVVVGTPCDDHAGDASGAAHAYSRTGSDWSLMDKLIASDAAINDALGSVVDMGADVAVLGTPWKDLDDEFAVGAVYVYTISPPNVDMGFRPDPDGYAFDNYGGVDLGDYTIEDMRQMFGDEAVCAVIEPECFVRPAALYWNLQANEFMNGGHCEGMAATSLRFFRELDDPADFQAGAGSTHDLVLANARRHVAYYHVEQLTDPVRAYRAWVRQLSPAAILEQVRAALSGSAPDPPTLSIFPVQPGLGHTLTPYAVLDQGGGTHWIRVYDSNHPGDLGRHVEVDTVAEAWQYDRGGSLGIWAGDDSTDSLGMVPLSLYAQPPVCPWCSWTQRATQAAMGEVWLAGPGHLLLTDSLGRRIGYLGEQFVDEIPGAYASPVLGGLDITAEPIYVVPMTDTYTILLDGGTLTQTQPVAVSYFGPGFATWLEGADLGPSSQDDLTINPDALQVAYRPGTAQEASLTLALEGVAHSDALQIEGADVGAGQTVTLTAEPDVGQLVYSHAQAGQGDYDIEITRISAAGRHVFRHAGVGISASDTHFLQYGAWQDSEPLELAIDHGSDGSIDEIVELENQRLLRVYLPLVFRGG